MPEPDDALDVCRGLPEAVYGRMEAGTVDLVDKVGELLVDNVRVGYTQDFESELGREEDLAVAGEDERPGAGLLVDEELFLVLFAALWSGGGAGGGAETDLLRSS